MRRARATHRRAAAIGLGGGLIAVALCLAPGAMAGPAAAPVAQPGSDLDSPCRAIVRSVVSERWVSVGERVGVRTRIDLSCPRQRRPYHVVFTIDADAMRAGAGEFGLGDDVRGLADALALEHNPYVRAGVVGYGSHAQGLCVPGNEPGIFVDCLHRAALPPDALAGDGGLADAVREATKALLLARGLASDRPSDHPLREGIVVLERPLDCPAQSGCGPERAACLPARREAREAAAFGIELSVVCLDQDCEASCLADMADRSYDLYAWDAMTRHQGTLSWQSELRVAEFALSEPLHPTLLVDPASIDYTAGQYNSSDHGITWHVATRQRAHEPVMLSYAVTTTVPGTYPVRLPDAGGVLVDTDGLAASFTVPGHVIEVTLGRLVHLHLPWAYKPLPPAPANKPLGNP